MQSQAAQETILPGPVVQPLSSLSDSDLVNMAYAGDVIEESYRVLTKAGLNIVGECLRGQGMFYQMNHYPQGDVYDNQSHSQYYYHDHRDEVDEHGHFHTFQRAAGMPYRAKPAAYGGAVARPMGDEAVCHIIAVSMDKKGFPTGLFATNRWVTGESWYSAEDVIATLDYFAVDHAFPNLPVNQWITAMVQLFKPEITALLLQRDRVIEQWEAEHPGEDVYEDRRLEVTGEIQISVEERRAELASVLA